MIHGTIGALLVSLATLCGVPTALAVPVCNAGPAQVMVIPSLHKLMASDPNYSYQQLYDIVAAFRPDRVGVEIRDEDLPRAETYLSANYPQEMVTLLELYRDRAFGFDWLGDELKGMPVPSDWWTKRSRIKQLERAWDASPSPQDDKTKQLTRDFEARSALRDEIARTASPGALANGPYDEVTAEYYRLAFKLTRDTPYALVPEWYAERDRHLADNVADDIRRHPGCRIAIVTGADHHGPIMATIKTLRTNVVLVKLP